MYKRQVLADVQKEGFDLVIFDTPAGMHGITGDVLRIADSVSYTHLTLPTIYSV